jgi:hypothetical protein
MPARLVASKQVMSRANPFVGCGQLREFYSGVKHGVMTRLYGPELALFKDG